MLSGSSHVIHPGTSYGIEPGKKLRKGDLLASAKAKIGIGHPIGSHETSRSENQASSPFFPFPKSLPPGKPEGMTPRFLSQREFRQNLQRNLGSETFPVLFENSEMLLIRNEKNCRSRRVQGKPGPSGGTSLKMEMDVPDVGILGEQPPKRSGRRISLDIQKAYASSLRQFNL